MLRWIKKHRYGNECLECIEQLFIGRIIGKKVSDIRAAERRNKSCQCNAPPTAYCDIFRRVFTLLPFAIAIIVERGNRLAKLCDAVDRRIFKSALVELDRESSIGSARIAACTAGLARARVSSGESLRSETIRSKCALPVATTRCG